MADLRETARDPRRDFMQATPREPISGFLSDLAASLYSPERTQALQGIARFFDVPELSRTLNRISYGEPITNIGKANVPLIPDDTAAAALLVSPLVTKGTQFGAKAGRLGVKVIGQEIADRVATGQSLLPKQVPQPRAAMFAVEPSPMMPKPQAPVSELGFYSATEQAALNLPRNKGTGQSFLNDLMKAPDVKKDELAWIGLDDFLKDKPNVTKQEVQDFISQNKVDLQEVRLGESPVEDPIGIAKRKAVFDKYEPEIQQLYNELDNVNAQKRNALKLANAKYDEMLDQLNKDGYMPTAQDYEAFNLAEKEVRQANRMQNDDIDIRNRLGKIQNMRDAEADAAYVVPETMPTKYQKYQLPGGKNYREILLKLPFKEPAMPKGYEVTSMQYDDGTVRYFANTPTTRSQGFRTQEEAQAELSKTASNLKGFRENLESYQSSHFNEPNILAHMRVNDRVDADGKKMLLVEEIQSDWHQAGRERGYIPSDMQKAKDNIQKRLNEIDAERTSLYERQTLLENAYNKKSYTDELSAIQTQLNNLQREYAPLANQLSTGLAGVPDAPFKDTWYQLSLKRILKYAADNGYERVGLTTGRQQAERYDLSKQISKVMWDKETGRLTAYDKNVTERRSDGRTVMDESGVTESKLSDYIGKEAAQKLIKELPDEEGVRFLSGLDLQVGGEGMKKYYDEIYPNFLEKYGKKWDAKVGETTIETGRTRDAQGIPSMYPTKEPIRYIDITPKMKESVSKGQPLFTAIPAGTLGLGGLEYADPFGNLFPQQPQPQQSAQPIPEKPRTWDAAAAQRAKMLEDMGTDPKTIWQQTGTWKGPDGKWRQEVMQ